MKSAALQAICDLALPRTCGGCATPGCALCPVCRGALDEIAARVAAPAIPDPCPEGFPPTWSQTAYDGPVAHLVRAHKDHGRRDAGPRLGALLRCALAELLTQDQHCVDALLAGERLLVCPMPSRPAATRERGREPAIELARRATHGVPDLRLGRLLRVSGHRRDQAGLTALQRSANVRGTIALSAAGRRLVPGRVCIVLDDIVTTGSSLAEARNALVSGGARHVVAATITATQRRAGDHPFTHEGSVV
ncbi:ComF family protein [Flexivirga caeni]|uniref:ComF family protein n=1 Tax=Flexivirga caeni TaxID=2294115 RepID=A0A3M9MCA0_9MICO|nr:ComF family protein [Flexivirga caeni]RNI23191.1 ComF family protein [Flexivirga caeni]